MNRISETKNDQVDKCKKCVKWNHMNNCSGNILNCCKEYCEAYCDFTCVECDNDICIYCVCECGRSERNTCKDCCKYLCR